MKRNALKMVSCRCHVTSHSCDVMIV